MHLHMREGEEIQIDCEGKSIVVRCCGGELEVYHENKEQGDAFMERPKSGICQECKEKRWLVNNVCARCTKEP